MKVKKSLAACPLKTTITDTRPDGDSLFHENGKKNEAVYRIPFAKNQEKATSRRTR
jgi:hypothetical protein